MPSRARIAFDENAKDVKRLLEIHGDVGGGTQQGRRYGLEVLNKSAVVLITAIWEAYCEDIALEAVEHLTNHVTDPSMLPTELRKKIASNLKAEKHELAVWDLAGTGWKAVLKARGSLLTAERTSKLNTPKTSQIKELFSDVLGLDDVSASWNWKGMSANSATKKLDRYITLRGAIAHRGVAATSVTKFNATDFFGHVKRLVGKTGRKVNRHVKTATGRSLW